MLVGVLVVHPYLTGGQLVVQGFSVGGVFEDLRYGDLLVHSLHLQAQQVSVYGLAADGLRQRTAP